MSNMSYCRFQNTRTDLKDCVEALKDIDTKGELSNDESRAMKRMVELCQTFIDEVERIEENQDVEEDETSIDLEA